MTAAEVCSLVRQRQPCSHEKCEVDGTTVYYAFGTQQHGPHEAVWRNSRYTVMVLVKPFRGTDAHWFIRFLKGVLALGVAPFSESEEGK